MPEKVFFETSDGFRIIGDFYKAGKEACVLLHQLNLGKSSFASFAEKLAENGITALAIDLRGHGESTMQNKKERHWQEFSEKEFREIALDVKASKKFLKEKGFEMKYIVGSSIGANTAINYSAFDMDVRKIIPLSPGMDFKGINTEANAPNVHAETLIVASEEDSYSFASARNLEGMIPKARLMELRGAGHGTHMFAKQGLEEELVQWLLE